MEKLTQQSEAVGSFLTVHRLQTLVYSSGYLQWPCIVLGVLLLHYLALDLMYRHGQKSTGSPKLPPMVPYVFPIIGSAFSFLWDPWSFVSRATCHAGKRTVSGVKLMGQDIYLMQGKENIESIWRSTSLSAATFIQSYALRTFFGMPAKSVAVYERDDTGMAVRPNAGSIVESHNRINYRTHILFDQMLSGSALTPLIDRFHAHLVTMIHGFEVQDNWMEMPDLYYLLQQRLSPCIIKSLCGPTILEENSDFVTTFWDFEYRLSTLSKKIPRILAPRAYADRDKLLSAVKKWHATARLGFKHEHESLDFEPLWGSKGIRQRQAMFSSVDDFNDYDTMACMDLGMIWAANTNAVPATFWTIFEIFKDQHLLSRVHVDVLGCVDKTVAGEEKIDVNKLLRLPLLQSIYTEVLRLRTHLFVARGSSFGSATIGDWLFPRGKAILISTTASHLDPEAWYEGPDNSHPVNTFWADRFLVGSGDDVKFSTDRSEGSWIPYGGGSRICPGRHFSKREIMLTVAEFVHNFDIRIKLVNSNLDMERRDFGLGVLGPACSVPFEIRRRQKGATSTV